MRNDASSSDTIYKCRNVGALPNQGEKANSRAADSENSERPTAGYQRQKVVHFHRRPFPGQFSIEGLFEHLRQSMGKAGKAVELAVVPFRSKGLIRRVANICWAAFRQGNINHITGDIHYLAFGLRPERTILTIHDCYPLERLNGWRFRVFKFFWFDVPVRRSVAVTVVSGETKRQLQRHVTIDDEKIVVIPDIVAPIFQPCLRPFDTESPRILQLGTKENKNLPRLIRALKGLPCHLHIIGALNDAIRAELTSCQVDFSSAENLSEEQIFQSYCDADLVCLVSTCEGFGMPIIEANSVGRPVVTSNISSMPEVAGDAACLVDPYDVVSIRDGIQRVIDNAEYRQQLVNNGLRNATRFQPDQVARQYIQLYQRISPC